MCLARSLDSAGLEKLSRTLSPPDMLAPGDFAYRLGDRTDRVYVLRSGAVKTITITPSGDEHVTGFHFAGEMFGLIGFTTGQHVNSAVALDTSSVCRISTGQLPELWSIGCDRGFLGLIGERENATLQQRLLMGKSRADARLSAFLLQMCERQERRGVSPESLYLPMRRTDLANYLGMTLESLSRTFRRLSEAVLIQVDGAYVQVCKPAELATIAGDY